MNSYHLERRPSLLSERVYGALLRTYPRRHREEFGGMIMLNFRDLCCEAQTGGIATLVKLWVRVLLPELFKEAAIERCGQGVGALKTIAVTRRLVTIGSLGAIAAGLISLTSGVLPYLKNSPASLRLLPWHLVWSLPWELPLVTNPAVGEVLTMVGFVSLYFLFLSRSRFALVGLGLISAPVIISLALGVCGCVVDLAHRWEAYSVVAISHGVAPVALAHELGTWLGAAGALLLGGAALRAPELGRWRALPLILSLMQSPLGSYLPLAMAAYMMEHTSLSIVPLVMATTPVLVDGPQALLGLGWVVLGMVMWRRRMDSKTQQPSTGFAPARRKEASET